ncbi:sugar phosphate isomerase/epimerase [Listeria sp. PSOL-1]|uniref:sugar phosphate isomerase/epimerase family protein n=1 Tax=Listeria sp. PSOL-1 TaxID=1844999 RepID=UPI0013D60F44|nr:TIM barrel protein [Listeria sp. PSOL-1]
MAIQLTINLDEISADTAYAMRVLKKNHIHTCELRTIDDQNIVTLDVEAIKKLKKQLNSYDISPIAISSPLLKWSSNRSKNIPSNLDLFGIDQNLSSTKKNFYIENIRQFANLLEVDRIRIFSFLGDIEFPVENLFQEPDFQQILTDQSHTYLIENELVCSISSLSEMTNLAKKITQYKASNLGIWLDISNLFQLEKQMTLQDIYPLLPLVKYIHLKDYVFDASGGIQYVPVGDGIIPYADLLPEIIQEIPTQNNVILSIETHEKNPDRKEYASLKSFYFIKEILKI